MTPVLGGKVTERLLLEPYLQLCTDSVFHVRKVSARDVDLGSEESIFHHIFWCDLMLATRVTRLVFRV